jgi:hypothetical protein
MTKILVISVGLLFLLASGATAAEQNLIDLHKNAEKNSKQCLSCHAQIKKEVSLNQKFKTFHRVHLESKLETPKNCTDCHSSVDLKDGSAASLKKQVDPQLCAGCHSGGMQGAKVLFAQ